MVEAISHEGLHSADRAATTSRRVAWSFLELPKAAAAGCSVVAIEANPHLASRLGVRFRDRAGFSLVAMAAGKDVGSAQLRLLRGADNGGDVDTQLSGLVAHPLYEGLATEGLLDVPVTSLRALVSAGLVPSDLGLLKIDTEGFDLSVLAGAGNLAPEVISVEFWNRNFVFNGGQTDNDISDYLTHFQASPYRWHVELYRRESVDEIGVRIQTTGSLARSWGNAYFFREQRQFNAFLQLCTTTFGASALEFC
jgi:FkbM family methyltransferase